jgi:uncharacterized SAM-dependent methyltransferase
MNRELQASFDLGTFSHIAFYNQDRHQIEMHLRSERDQHVVIRDLDMQTSFRAGETIHTEISRKFDLDEISMQLATYGFRRRAYWTDEHTWFAVCLFQFVDNKL